MEKRRLLIMESEEITWMNNLKDKVKTIQKNKELFCLHCAKFTPFKELRFHGRNENKECIASDNVEDIFEYEGYEYVCSKCEYRNEGMDIQRIDI